jgi:hypothetical protein
VIGGHVCCCGTCEIFKNRRIDVFQFSDVSEPFHTLIASSRLTDAITPNYISLFTLITMSTISCIVLKKERSSIFRRPSFKKTVEEKEPTKTKQRRPSLKTFLLKLKSTKNTKKMAERPELRIVATVSQDGSEIEYDEEGGNDKMEYTEYVEEKELDIRGCEAPDALALCMIGSLIAVQLFAQ